MSEDTKKLETLSYKQEAKTIEEMAEDFCNCPPEQPNLKIIAEIEGLISQVNDKIISLPAGNFAKDFNKYACIGKAIEEIDIFQKITLVELRKAFE